MDDGMTDTAPRPLVLLIAEDEPLVRMAAADALGDAGCEVIEAADADEAIAVLDADPRVRVLVTDVRMPGPIDGLALARMAAARWPWVAVVVASGHALPGDGKVPEGTLFLAKPYTAEALLDCVRRAVKRPVKPMPAKLA